MEDDLNVPPRWWRSSAIRCLAASAVSVLALACSGGADRSRSKTRLALSGCETKTYGDHEYLFCFDEPADFSTARERCASAEMDLVAIDGDAENAFIANAVSSPTLVGVSDGDNEGVWRRVADGRALWCGTADGHAAGAGYANWANGEPRIDSRCTLNEQASGVGYWQCKDKRSWWSADQACRSSGGQLARIDTRVENDLIANGATSHTWIGATDATEEGTWSWSDGDVFWSGGEPQNGLFVSVR